MPDSILLSGTPRTVHVNVRNGGSIAAQLLTVRAGMTGDRALVHAAVALDPLTSALLSLPQIRQMADRMLET